VYGLSDKLALAIFQRSAPTLLAYGGTYANLKKMNVNNILPFVFFLVLVAQRRNKK
jgi:hypothetical protein